MFLPDVSIIINGHREGMVAWSTLLAAKRNALFAQNRGIKVEVVCILDKPDSITSEIFQKFSSSSFDARIIDVSFHDLGLARNMGVEISQGSYLAMLDGDDLWCDDWIYKAFEASQNAGREAIWHPEVNLIFGTEEYLLVHPDMDDPEFVLADLVYNNLWTSLSFAERSVYVNHPYRAKDDSDTFGYEDWSWNLQTVESGYIHKVVIGTVHFIRKRVSSLSQRLAAASAMPWVTSFDPSKLYR